MEDFSTSLLEERDRMVKEGDVEKLSQEIKTLKEQNAELRFNKEYVIIDNILKAQIKTLKEENSELRSNKYLVTFMVCMLTFLAVI